MSWIDRSVLAAKFKYKGCFNKIVDKPDDYTKKFGYGQSLKESINDVS